MICLATAMCLQNISLDTTVYTTQTEYFWSLKDTFTISCEQMMENEMLEFITFMPQNKTYKILKLQKHYELNKHYISLLLLYSIGAHTYWPCIQ